MFDNLHDLEDKIIFESEMQNFHHRKLASNAPSKTNKSSLINSTTVPPQFAIQLKQAMDDFMKLVSNLLQNFRNVSIDYYYCLNFMRQHNFFNDVAAVIQEDIGKRVKDLTELTNAKNDLIRQQKQEINKLIQHKRQNPKQRQKQDKKKVISAGMKSISEGLYRRAKVLTENQFCKLCDEIILSDKLVLSRVQNHSKFKKVQTAPMNTEPFQLLSQIQKHVLSMHQKMKAEEIEQLKMETKQFISELKLIMQKTDTDQNKCMNPCCRPKFNDENYRVNKASILLHSTGSKSFAQVYKSNKSEEYFGHYYRNSSFNLKKVISVERTHLQEMTKIEAQHRKNLCLRKRFMSKG